MQFTTLFASAVMAVVAVHAQTPTSSSAVSGTASLTPAQASQATCLDACSATDTVCRAACIVINEGDYAQSNATISCIGSCTQGNGTAAENLAYENCNKACIAAASTETGLTLATTAASAAASSVATVTTTTGTDSSATASASSSAASASGSSSSHSGSSTHSGSSSATGTSSRASSTGSATAASGSSTASTSSSAGAAAATFIPWAGAAIFAGAVMAL